MVVIEAHHRYIFGHLDSMTQTGKQGLDAWEPRITDDRCGPTGRLEAGVLRDLVGRIAIQDFKLQTSALQALGTLSDTVMALKSRSQIPRPAMAKGDQPFAEQLACCHVIWDYVRKFQ